MVLCCKQSAFSTCKVYLGLAMSYSFSIRSLMAFYLRAKTRYDVHSPYLSRLVEDVIRSKDQPLILQDIENQRRLFLNDDAMIEKVPLGAGSKRLNNQQMTVSKLAKTSLCTSWQGKLYHHLARVHQPKKILELGTCLGISSAYLYSGAPQSVMLTLEGDRNLVPLAKQSLEALFDEGGPEITLGRFSNTLPIALEDLAEVDLVLMDGDHSYHATLAYFQQIKPYLSADAIVIVHDIHWSEGMLLAWREMQKDEAIFLSIDLFDLGLLCKAPTMTTKQSFSYIPWILKPWRIGLF